MSDWKPREIGSCTSKDQLALDAERYAKQVLEDVDLEIDLSDVEWEASAQMSRSHANIREQSDGTILAKVSWKTYQNRQWEVVENAVRWLLAQIYSIQNPQLTDLNFRDVEKRLDVPSEFDDPPEDPNYVIECQRCGHEYTRQVRSKLVKRPERYKCQCGGKLEVTKGA